MVFFIYIDMYFSELVLYAIDNVRINFPLNTKVSTTMICPACNYRPDSEMLTVNVQ